MIGYQSGLFPSLVIAGIVTIDDATRFPELDLIQELPTWDANLAHELLIKVVGG